MSLEPKAVIFPVPSANSGDEVRVPGVDMKPGPFQLLPARRSSGWAKQLIEYLVTARIKLIVDPGSPGIICRALVVVFASGLRGCAGLQVGSGAARDGMPRTSLKPRSGDCSQRMRAHAGRHRSPRARERGLAGKQEHRRGADARVMVRASTRPWLSGLLISRATLAQVQRSEGAGSRVRDVVLPNAKFLKGCTQSVGGRSVAWARVVPRSRAGRGR